jgi:hypothetical protein
MKRHKIYALVLQVLSEKIDKKDLEELKTKIKGKKMSKKFDNFLSEGSERRENVNNIMRLLLGLNQNQTINI